MKNASPIIQLRDYDDASIDAFDLLGGDGRDRYSDAEGRAEQLLRRNESRLGQLSISANLQRQNGRPKIHFSADRFVGAIALSSPRTAKYELGVSVTPRFNWSIVTDWMPVAGFSAAPTILESALLPSSVSGIPPWVLSSAILKRITALLQASRRRYKQHTELTTHPKGAIDWARYASQVLPSGKHTALPCTYPDLSDDFPLLSAVKYVAESQHEALLPHRHHSNAAKHLISMYAALLTELRSIRSERPSVNSLRSWNYTSDSGSVFRDGILAIEWTMYDRGLGGLSSLAGLPWRLDMASYFEAIVSGVARRVATNSASTFQSGAEGNTTKSITWHNRHSSSLSSLVPDAIMKYGDTVFVVDAKYKRHGALIAGGYWDHQSDDSKESHRHDVHQILAYSSLFSEKRIVGCLVYPDHGDKIEHVDQLMRRVCRGTLPAQGGRSVEIALIPLSLASSLSTNEAVFTRILNTPL